MNFLPRKGIRISLYSHFMPITHFYQDDNYNQFD